MALKTFSISLFLYQSLFPLIFSIYYFSPSLSIYLSICFLFISLSLSNSLSLLLLNLTLSLSLSRSLTHLSFSLTHPLSVYLSHSFSIYSSLYLSLSLFPSFFLFFLFLSIYLSPYLSLLKKGIVPFFYFVHKTWHVSCSLVIAKTKLKYMVCAHFSMFHIKGKQAHIAQHKLSLSLRFVQIIKNCFHFIYLFDFKSF